MNNLTKKETIALQWMNDNFGFNHLKLYISPTYPNSVFYKKDEKIVIEQDCENKYFWFRYDEIWSFFEKFFDMQHKQIQDVLKVWLEQQSNLREFKPALGEFYANDALEQQSTLTELRPVYNITYTSGKLEAQSNLRELK